MLRSLVIPVLTIASFIPLASAGDGLVPVSPAIYHPGPDHQTVIENASDSYSRGTYYRQHRRHRHHKAAKRIGLGAAGGAAIGAVAGGGKGALIGGAAGAGAGALYNKHEEDKHR